MALCGPEFDFGNTREENANLRHDSGIDGLSMTGEGESQQ
jgi:hypothetical protein